MSHHKPVMPACLCSALVGVVGLAAGTARAQQTKEVVIAPPGARAAAMGGAFIALADDATASEANPAGLTILSRPEVSFHFRRSSYDISVPTFYDPDDAERLVRSIAAPSFISGVYPWRSAAASLYYQRAGDGVTPKGSGDRDTIEHLGLSIAYRLSSRLSVGGSIRRSRAVYRYLDRSADAWAEGSDSETSFNGGLRFDAHPKVSLGAVFKNAPFGLPQTVEGGIAVRPTERWTLTTDVTSQLGWQTNLRLGSEYAFGMGRSTLALRAGFYRHVPSLRENSQGGGLWPDKKSHVTVGGGLVFLDRYQLDAAVDLADEEKKLLLSTVVRF